jgi:hypothetical protein
MAITQRDCLRTLRGNMLAARFRHDVGMFRHARTMAQLGRPFTHILSRVIATVI